MGTLKNKGNLEDIRNYLDKYNLKIMKPLFWKPESETSEDYLWVGPQFMGGLGILPTTHKFYLPGHDMTSWHPCCQNNNIPIIFVLKNDYRQSYT